MYRGKTTDRLRNRGEMDVSIDGTERRKEAKKYSSQKK